MSLFLLSALKVFSTKNNKFAKKIMLRFILWILIFYVLFRVLVRYVFPFLVSYFLKSSQNKFYRQNPNINKKKEGEVSIDHVPEKGKKGNKDKKLGEYVDYEEEEE